MPLRWCESQNFLAPKACVTQALTKYLVVLRLPSWNVLRKDDRTLCIVTSANLGGSAELLFASRMVVGHVCRGCSLRLEWEAMWTWPYSD